jgi:hypothetical protein
MAKLEMAKISIYKCEKCLPLDMGNCLPPELDHAMFIS